LCTLVAIHRTIEGAPLVIAANRDEYFERPAEGPALRRFASTRPGSIDDASQDVSQSISEIVAPLDVRAGGTWLGLNAFGVFGAVTNLRCTAPDPSRSSRGGVVPAALRERSAARAADVLKALPENAYNPFHCFVADDERAFLLSYRDAPRVRELSPGVHVVGNVDPDEEPAPKVGRVREAVAASTERLKQAPELAASGILEDLARICREHETGGGGPGDTCVHLETYGTRSSALLLRASERENDRFLFAAKAPCESEYEDFSNLLFQVSSESGAGWSTALERTAVRNAS